MIAIHMHFFSDLYAKLRTVQSSVRDVNEERSAVK